MLKDVVRKIPGGKRMAELLGLSSRQNVNHRQFLLDMLPKGSVGAEIGVLRGNFAQHILDSVSPRELHLIDPWKHQTASAYQGAWYGGLAKDGQKGMDRHYSHTLKRFRRNIRAGQVKVHRGYSTDELQQFPDEFFDWVYIDGNHVYEYVKQDLELSLRKVKTGGYIAGDDYAGGGWWKDGVIRAVDEFSANPAVQLLETRNAQFIFVKKNPADS